MPRSTHAQTAQLSEALLAQAEQLEQAAARKAAIDVARAAERATLLRNLATTLKAEVEDGANDNGTQKDAGPGGTQAAGTVEEHAGTDLVAPERPAGAAAVFTGQQVPNARQA